MENITSQEVILTNQINEGLAKKVEALELELWNQKDNYQKELKNQIGRLFKKLSNPITFATDLLGSVEDYTPADYKVAKNRVKDYFEIEEMSDDAQRIVESLNVMGLSDEVGAILNEGFDLDEHLERLDRYDTLNAIDVLTNSLRKKY